MVEQNPPCPLFLQFFVEPEIWRKSSLNLYGRFLSLHCFCFLRLFIEQKQWTEFLLPLYLKARIFFFSGFSYGEDFL